ncbi:MAG: hypothetical protein JWQ97_338 [Phenylobacterium sp.]|nr:hypothetical protein [Phenylobacterium sp.]
MRPSYAPRGGFVLIKSPSLRQQAERRRAVAVCGLLALALASGIIGTLTHSHAGSHTEALGKAHTGPFSYFSSE